jgi:acyl carrier protein
MTQNKILKILKDIRPEFNFKNSNDYFKSGLLDSLDIIILVENLEKEFQIKIAGEEIIPKNFSNLKKIINFIKKK